MRGVLVMPVQVGSVWCFGYLQISLANHKPRLAVGKLLSLRTGRVKRQSNIGLLHTRTAGE
jgi:hypothetical protein